MTEQGERKKDCELDPFKDVEHVPFCDHCLYGEKIKECTVKNDRKKSILQLSQLHYDIQNDILYLTAVCYYF